MTKSTRSPFTDRIHHLRASGYRYTDLEEKCGRVRSTAWFNRLVNLGSTHVAPPTSDSFDGFAALMGVTSRDVALMIAEEWYEVVEADQSPRVRSLATRIDSLSDADTRLVEQLVQRLQPDAA